MSAPLTGRDSILGRDGCADLGFRSGGEAPRSVALGGERTLVGRSPEADVQLEDEAVSWNHLEIERRERS